jgi:hypothetical protein
MNIRPTAWMLYALASVLAVPVLVFIAGRLLAGPYEGKFGLLGLMGNIYKDALTGNAGAWFILLAPLLMIAIWWASFALCRNLESLITGTKR